MCIAIPNYLDHNLHVGIDNMTSSVTVDDTSKFLFNFDDQVLDNVLDILWSFYTKPKFGLL